MPPWPAGRATSSRWPRPTSGTSHDTWMRGRGRRLRVRPKGRRMKVRRRILIAVVLLYAVGLVWGYLRLPWAAIRTLRDYRIIAVAPAISLSEAEISPAQLGYLIHKPADAVRFLGRNRACFPAESIRKSDSISG